jgi:hypothetical protein
MTMYESSLNVADGGAHAAMHGTELAHHHQSEEEVTALRSDLVASTAPGRGDRSWTWKLAGSAAGDEFFYRTPGELGKITPMFSLAIVDGNPLQAIFGNLQFLLPLAGFVLGIMATIQTHGAALPPTLGIDAALVVIGLLSGFAGLVGFIPILVGAVVTGHCFSVSEYITLFVLGCNYFAGPQIARRIRPLRSHRDRSGFDRFWHIAGDYSVQIVMAAFILGKFPALYPLVSGKEVTIAESEHTMWVVVIAACVVRQILETIAREWYPQRTVIVAPRRQGRGRHELLDLAFRTVVQISFVAAAIYTVVGPNWRTPVICGAYALMLFVEGIKKPFPFVTWIHRIVPVGIARIVFVMVIGELAAKYFIEYGVKTSGDLTGSIFLVVAALLFLLTFFGRFRGQPWGPGVAWKFIGAGIVSILICLAIGAISFV